MKKTQYMILAALTLSAACSNENTEPSGNGSLSLSVSTTRTKAAMTQSELLDNAIVKIYKADFSGKVREYKNSEVPANVYLPADEYRIDVTAGASTLNPVPVASWEQESYTGSETVTVTAGQNTSVTVKAKMCNAVSRISFDPSVSELIEAGYTCTIGLSETDASQQLVYTADKSGAVGYFLPEGFEPSLYWTFNGTLKKDGSAVTKSGRVENVEGGKRYEMTLKYTEKDGLMVVRIEVDASTNDKQDNIIFVPVSTGVSSTSKYEIWAGHFTAHADVDEGEYDPNKVFFEYRQAGTSDWTRKAATRESEGTFSAKLDGLTGSTEYEYRIAITPAAGGSEEYVDASSTVTTDAAPLVPNGSFEATSEAESSKYKSFYNPSATDASLKTKWWDTGNNGSTLVGSSSVIAYPVTDDVKDGSQSVCLQSRYVVVKFAAGNLFSGHFGELVGTKGGTVFFGRPFTGRPTAMRLWAKYKGGIINRVDTTPPGVDIVKNTTPDKASLRVALGTWDYKKYGGDASSPILVNTTKQETFVDFRTDTSTIAFGEELLEGQTAWKQITIPIVYRNETTYPTHIVISFAASMYGDYFTGYDDAQLWLDGVELLYE